MMPTMLESLILIANPAANQDTLPRLNADLFLEAGPQVNGRRPIGGV